MLELQFTIFIEFNYQNPPHLIILVKTCWLKKKLAKDPIRFLHLKASEEQ
jgi:hypothetical protein